MNIRYERVVKKPQTIDIRRIRIKYEKLSTNIFDKLYEVTKFLKNKSTNANSKEK